MRNVSHLNVIGFRAAVAAAKDRGLRGRPFVITGAAGGRALVWDVSAEAMKAGVFPGMSLALAEKRVADLKALPPDPTAYGQVNGIIDSIIARYAPVYENDAAGNVFLDLSGTGRLFGKAVDVTSHICNEIFDAAGITATAALGSNKVITKVGTRTIRPTGLIHIREGEEAAFLAHQDIRLLPGIGPALLRTAAVTGIREIGKLAGLLDGEALALFGKQGLRLRDWARGIDGRPVEAGDSGERTIRQRLDFGEDVIEGERIAGALVYLAEHTGFEMRSGKLGASYLGLRVVYSDGVSVLGEKTAKRLFVMDTEIRACAEELYKRIVARRIRIRSMTLTLGGFKPLGWEPDLFIPEPEIRDRKIQAAADRIRGRYGIDSLMRASVLGPALPVSAAQ
ncbi:DNA polymerase [Treponema primitia]|uniref:DNA polymerase Y family protein n=1 Tax=Treponema primitia TaxID=88058 RepID=UPI0039808FF0